MITPPPRPGHPAPPSPNPSPSLFHRLNRRIQAALEAMSIAAPTPGETLLEIDLADLPDPDRRRARLRRRQIRPETPPRIQDTPS